MENLAQEAKRLIVEFKGSDYAFGSGVLEQVGPITAAIGKRALVVSRLSSNWLKEALEKVTVSLRDAGVEVLGPVQGAAPNAPREDVYRLQGHILHKKPDVIVSGGSIYGPGPGSRLERGPG